MYNLAPAAVGWSVEQPLRIGGDLLAIMCNWFMCGLFKILLKKRHKNEHFPVYVYLVS